MRQMADHKLIHLLYMMNSRAKWMATALMLNEALSMPLKMVDVVSLPDYSFRFCLRKTKEAT